MKILKWVLISVCVLKIASLSLRVIIYPKPKEIEQFFTEELSRKYNEHSIALGYIGGTSEMHTSISRDSTDFYLRNRSDDKWPEFKRTRFQGYAKYLRTLDTVWQKDAQINLESFPMLLRNTVAEESAKREILLHLKNMQPQHRLFEHWNLMGLISYINIYSDSMQINLIPFVFESHLPFDSCNCGSQTLLSNSNPFYYTGSLFNWKCTYQHPKTKEIQTYGLQTVE